VNTASLEITTARSTSGSCVTLLRWLVALPAGICVYVVSGMERDVPLETIFRGAMPFLLAMIVAAVLLILFPDIALILPRWIHP